MSGVLDPAAVRGSAAVADHRHAHLRDHLGRFRRRCVGVEILLDALLLRVADVAMALVVGDDASRFGQASLALDRRDQRTLVVVHLATKKKHGGRRGEFNWKSMPEN